MLCQLKTDSLLLNVKENISQEQQSQYSDEIKKEKGFQETGWIKRVFCSVLHLFFSPPCCAGKSRSFHALHFVCSNSDTAVGRAWQEKNQSLV